MRIGRERRMLCSIYAAVLSSAIRRTSLWRGSTCPKIVNLRSSHTHARGYNHARASIPADRTPTSDILTFSTTMTSLTTPYLRPNSAASAEVSLCHAHTNIFEPRTSALFSSKALTYTSKCLPVGGRNRLTGAHPRPGPARSLLKQFGTLIEVIVAHTRRECKR